MYMMTMKAGMKTRKKAAFRVYVSCNIAELAAFWSPFQQETVCEKFQIAREKVVVTVTTTVKSGVTTVTYKVAPMLGGLPIGPTIHWSDSIKHQKIIDYGFFLNFRHG